MLTESSRLLMSEKMQVMRKSYNLYRLQSFFKVQIQSMKLIVNNGCNCQPGIAESGIIIRHFYGENRLIYFLFLKKYDCMIDMHLPAMTMTGNRI